MSSLEDLYKEIIMDHYRNPRNTGELAPPATKTEGYNPLCGDNVTLYLDVRDGVIADVKLVGSGCSISQSSASMMTSAIKGKTKPEALALVESLKQMMDVHVGELEGKDPENNQIDPKLGDLQALKGVVQFPVRIKCATLAWNTLDQALAEE